jgi:hypothetical protein
MRPSLTVRGAAVAGAAGVAAGAAVASAAEEEAWQLLVERQRFRKLGVMTHLRIVG